MSRTTITDQQAGFDDGNSILVDGLTSHDGAIEYWGRATKQPNGKWACHANIGGKLYVVEVSISQPKGD